MVAENYIYYGWKFKLPKNIKEFTSIRENWEGTKDTYSIRSQRSGSAGILLEIVSHLWEYLEDKLSPHKFQALSFEWKH